MKCKCCGQVSAKVLGTPALIGTKEPLCDTCWEWARDILWP